MVEDDPRSLELTSAFVAESGAEVLQAASVDQALAALTSHGANIRLVITDIRLRDQSGLDFFRLVRQRHPATPVILVTAFANTDEAVGAMRDGALYDFTKPINFPLLLNLVRETLEKQALQAQVADLRARLSGRIGRRIVGTSRPMQIALDQAAAVAQLDTTVLLVGETGTGKELFAEFIHTRSPRHAHPLVAVNCAALPEPLLESELFGHERGAFTGAVARKPGRFEQASGGTLFLDEVGDMSLGLQAKLLRALEARQVEPLGSTRPVRTDARIIGATHRDLAAAVAGSMFREDLYYRLNVFPIALPALRDRRDDVPVLAQQFLDEFRQTLGKPVEAFEPDALDALCAYRWPGNVRELRHAIERAVILAQAPRVRPDDLPPAVTAAAPGGPAGNALTPGGRDTGTRPLADVERQAILDALAAAGGNQTRAARALGITRNQIQYWLRTRGLRG